MEEKIVAEAEEINLLCFPTPALSHRHGAA